MVRYCLYASRRETSVSGFERRRTGGPPGSDQVRGPFGRRLYIEHMDWLLEDDPDHFEQYAIKDAQICALHVERMLIFARDDLGLDLRRPPITLGSLAVKYLEKRWEHEGIDPGGAWRGAE